MPHTLIRRISLACAIICLCSLTTAYGQYDETTAGSTDPHGWWKPESGQRTITGAALCYRCHKNPLPEPGKTVAKTEPKDTGGGNSIFADPNASSTANEDWVLLSELYIWENYDKHLQAYTVLLGERATHMGKVLGITDDEGKSIVHRDKRCVACHSSYPVEQLLSDEQDSGLIPASMTTDIKLNTGVSCEGCHGPAGMGIVDGKQVQGWDLAHINPNPNTWRFKSPEWKFQEHGFLNVRDKVTRTRICASCHIGNVRQGKVVTHEMYAAGHPPLPGFEISTFIHQEPKHWRDLEQKSKNLRESFLKATGKELDVNALNRTHTSLVSSLVAMSEVLRLTSDLINDEVGFPIDSMTKPAWPELSSFACFNCHHDLKDDSWRQKRKWTPTPGRPVMHEWPLAVARVTMKYMGKEDEFDQQYGMVAAALDSQPFGSPSAMKENCTKVANWLEEQARALDKQDIPPADAPKLLKLIAEVAETEPIDYDAARQLVWLASTIQRERLNPPKEGEIPTPFEGWYPNREELTDPVSKILAGFDSLIMVDLRQGRTTTFKYSENSQERTNKEVELTKVLPMISDYDPDAVREHFKKLADAVSQ